MNKNLNKILSNWKLVGGVFLAVILFFFGKELKKWLEDLFGDSTNKDDSQEEDISQKIKENAEQGSNLTVDEAYLIANQLENAFDYSQWGMYGTDEDLLWSLLDSSYNTDARTLIYVEFGHRKYDGVGTPIGFMDAFSYNYNLSQWARAELSGSSLNNFINYFKNTPFII